MYQRFKITQKQKQVIEEQKILVDKAYDSLQEKNKEVTDSILYARRIQQALITSEKYIENALNKLMRNK
jgi:flagellar biosynthesis regulator FlaF